MLDASCDLNRIKSQNWFDRTWYRLCAVGRCEQVSFLHFCQKCIELMGQKHAAKRKTKPRHQKNKENS